MASNQSFRIQGFQVARVDYVCLLLAVALTIPITLFPVLNYEFNLTMLALPFAMYAILKSIKSTPTILFMVCIAAGTLSCLIAEYREPDSSLIRHLLSLALVMLTASYAFLGRETALDTKTTIRYLGYCSAIFAIVITVPLLISGEAVRVEREIDHFAVVNVSFFKLPIFGSFGILSLAHLFAMQAFLCCAAIYSERTPQWLRIISALGLSALVFLVSCCDARSAQLAIIGLIVFMVVDFFFNKRTRNNAAFACAAIILAGMIVPQWMTSTNSRFVQTVERIEGKPSAPIVHESRPSKGLPDSAVHEANKPKDQSLTSGRYTLLEAALDDIESHPLTGTGFRSYSGPELPLVLANNSSTHVYYLTLLWKGGAIFFVPFLMFLLALAAGINRPLRFYRDPELQFALAMVLTSFLWLAMLWDSLNVPSAGALAFFVFGLISRRQTSS